MINKSCIWKSHLYGESKNQGLLKDLSKIVGILRRLRNFIPDKKFSQIVNGIYTTKQIYGLTALGGLWMDEEQRNSIMTTKEDKRKMQAIQNSVMWII